MQINRHAWDQACQTMGHTNAAIALGIVCARWQLHEIESPGGYLLGIVKKWQKGKADLEGSVWGLLKNN